jgi:hypothetical protein
MLMPVFAGRSAVQISIAGGLEPVCAIDVCKSHVKRTVTLCYFCSYIDKADVITIMIFHSFVFNFLALIFLFQPLLQKKSTHKM